MKVLKLAILAISLGLGPIQTYADQTNVVQDLRIQLFGVSQGGTSTTSGASFVFVDSRRVSQVLAAATGNTFSSTGRLVVVTPLGGGPSSIQVRDGSTKVDVTSFFVYQTLSGSVDSSFLNTRSRRSFSLEYNIERFALQDTVGFPPLGLHFDVNGFAVRRTTPQINDLRIDVSGTGDRGGILIIFRGSIEVRGGTLEVQSGGGGGVVT